MFATVVDYILSIPKPDFDGKYDTFVSRYLLNKVSFLNDIYISHLHQVLYVAVSYHLLFLASYFIFQPLLSKILINKNDKDLIAKDSNKKKRNQVAMHVVSFIQAVCILEFCVKAMYEDADHYFTFVTVTNATERIFGYTVLNEKITILACGYFLWDMAISAYCSTPAFMVHGVVSFTVYSIGLSHFINYYAAVFLFFELSNPFLNLRWFANHYKKSDSILAKVNEITFMVMFFVCRIAWGFLQIGLLITDFTLTYTDPRFQMVDAIAITLGNFVLNILNLYWFMIMLKIAREKILGTKDNKKVKSD
ncbi:hypothetical protein HANVADRAFT_38208 [Hanseniaspora valbyensis NRRL Y-1626]|uniref:TLC domain-containing protein n=1 Tax=Hanseniaspora valbyensis NRRL Y-1626 TaxID=766949 RepID=A0A1B7TFV7_9ASCO|nr:hypothetical protein HANVADRAFT_38208 [Hanseniaspora valbyensis NRRL Y-1626]